MIANNPLTIAYRVYLDDFSGNTPSLVYDTGRQALSNQVIIADLITGASYKIAVKSVNVIGES